MYELSKIDVERGKTIIVAHTPPYNARDRIITGEPVGSKSVRKFIEKKEPLIWACGHIHESFGVERIGNTYIFNSACRPEMNKFQAWVVTLNDEMNEVIDYKKIEMECF